MSNNHSPRPVFGQPGWRRRMESRYGWDKEFFAVGLILVMLFISVVLLRADEGTGLPDPKEMAQQPPPPASEGVDLTFLPLPSWASAKMPALPEQLKPMGHRIDVAKPSSAAVAETGPDQPPMPKKLPQVYPLASSKDPAPAASNSPANIAVSPFLEWIKDHPQEAAAQARKDAATASTAAPAPAPGSAPYWMPPMIDTSSDAPAAQAGGSGSGSAAIYSTPQR
jgi:hypothetical protein